MLGPDRFNFETPNVIDPGELPPSRPSRHGANDNAKDFGKNRNKENATSSWGSTSSNDPYFCYNNNNNNNNNLNSDLHERNSRNYKPSLSQGIKLSDYRVEDYYDYKDDDNDNHNHHGEDLMVRGAPVVHPISPLQERDDNDDNDTDYGHGSQLPSSEQARLFAAAMLTESDRRKQYSSQDQDLQDNSSRKSQREQRQRAIGTWLGVVVLCVGFVLAVVVALRQVNSNNSDGDMSPRMTATVDWLHTQGITHETELTTPGTPQHRAAVWIANQDKLQLDIPANDDDMDRTTTTAATTTEEEENPPYSPFVQRYALAVFYYSTNGDEWSHSLQFVSDSHECSWFQTMPDAMGEIFAVGVTCDAELRVRNLLIPSNNCQGTIPNEIRHLSFLDFLSLKHNQLSGSIPASLSQLKDLDYLDLKNNQLTGTIPKFLGQLQQLQVLGLSQNQLQGSLPETLGTLQRLKTLAMDDNLLTGSLFPVLATLTNLEYLYAENNNLEAQVNETFFRDFQQLVELDLSGNNLESSSWSSSSIPVHLFALPNLQILDLSDNNVNGNLPQTLPHNHVLEYISLRQNQVLGPIPFSISNLASLQHLDLESNAMTGQLPATLAELTDLHFLFLGKNPWTAGTIPEEWQSLTKLRELSLDNAQRIGEIPSWIITNTQQQLKLLDLRRNELTGTIPDDISSLKRLVYLLLSDNKLTGPIPENIGRMAELSIVALHQNGLIGDVNSLCKSSVYTLDVLTTDCGAVSCPCCDSCCDSDHCYDEVIWDSLEHSTGSWEGHFQRADYSFNPHILNILSTKQP